MVLSSGVRNLLPTPQSTPGTSPELDAKADHDKIETILLGIQSYIQNRVQADENLLNGVRAETSQSKDLYRMHILEDEVRYRRLEEGKVFENVSGLLRRIGGAKETIDMNDIDRQAATKRRQDDERLERLARERVILADFQRRAREAESLRREAARLTELTKRPRADLERVWPTTPRPLPQTPRVELDERRRRTVSEGRVDLNHVKAVFDTCRVVADAHRRHRQEAQSRSTNSPSTSRFATYVAFNGDDDAENEIPEEDVTITQFASPPVVTVAPPPINKKLAFLQRQLRDTHAAVNEKFSQWEVSKALRKYKADWSCLLSATTPPSEPLTFVAFPWPSVESLNGPYDLNTTDIERFLYHETHSEEKRVKALESARAQWAPETCTRLLKYISVNDLEKVKLGQVIVRSCLEELALKP